MAIILCGFALRVALAFVWQSSIEDGKLFKFGDSDTYWVLAKSIGDGTEYEYGSPDSKVFRAPMYPIVLSPWTKLDPVGSKGSWQSVMCSRVEGCVFGAICIALVIYLASNIAGSQRTLSAVGLCGLSAGILAMLYPGAIGMSIFILSESVFCPLALASLLCTCRAVQDAADVRGKTSGWMIVSGLFSGAACLARPSWSLWPALLFIYLFFALRYSARNGNSPPDASQVGWNRRWGLSCLLFCLGICISMAPWWIRNFAVTGKFVPTTLQVGASLYDGWHSGATGSSDEQMAFVQPYLKEQRDEDQKIVSLGGSLDGTFEWRLDQRLRNAAIQWAQQNSSDAIWLGLVKLRKTWSPLPVARELGGNAIRWAEAIGYLAIMSFAFVGMWKCRQRIGSWLFAMPCVYFACLHMFFIGSVRYRQPAVLFLCVLGGVGFAELIGWLVGFIWKRKIIDGSIVTNDVTADPSP